jgi:hypothetical protein
MREDEHPTIEELERLIAHARDTVRQARVTIQEALHAVERAKRLCEELQRRVPPPGGDES